MNHDFQDQQLTFVMCSQVKVSAHFFSVVLMIMIGYDISDESSKLKHDAPGLLTMAVADRDLRGSLFNLTFGANRHLDRCVSL